MVRLVQGDITQAETDAIVNAANHTLLGGGGVDGAIHRAAGPSLLEACRSIPEVNGLRCPAGEARITPAGNLRSQFVIHAVGPRYHIDPDPAGLLESVYRNCLAVAQEYRLESIAFPAISCGVYAYPVDEAAKIAVSTCARHRKDLLCSFYLFDPNTLGIFEGALGAIE